MSKICISCKEELDFSLFTFSKRNKDGYSSQCKKCRSEYVKNYRKNPDVKLKEKVASKKRYEEKKPQILEAAKLWRINNIEKSRSYTNKYAEKNREKKREADKARYWANPELSRQKSKQKYLQRVDKIKDSQKKWREANKNKVRAWGRAWCQLNKEKYALRAEHRRKLKIFMTELDVLAMKEAALLCELRGQVTGFLWQIDHITPLSKGGTHAAENLQVVPAKWNAAKRDRHSEKYFGWVSGAPTEFA